MSVSCLVSSWLCLTRESESRGDSHTCHAPDESRVYGVHEDELPGHFRAVDMYVHAHRGVQTLDDDEDDE